MNSITSKQWFQIISGVVSSFITAGALFTTLFGEPLTLKIIACLGLFNITLNSIGAALSGQGNLVKDVLAMPGVEKINVNGAASQTLAAIAIDPAVDKIAPTLAAQQAVTNTAKGA